MTRAGFLERFVAVVHRRGDAVALRDADGTCWSYHDLWRHVCGVAAAWSADGVRPGDRVALDTGRSAAHVIGVLAAWQSGAAWVPIGDGTPPARRARMCEITQPVWVRDQTSILTVSARLDATPRRNAPDDLAWIVCTSGSTGDPKAVAVAHRGLVPLLDAQIAAFGLDHRSRCAFALSPLFDASISDLGTALLAGATLCVTPSADDARFLPMLRELQLSCADVPPAWLSHQRPENLPSTLHTLVVGGAPSEPARLAAHAERRRVVNVYGPTEATVCTSLCVVDPARWTRPLLGAPLPGVRYRAVDGELWIAGAALAEGYVGDPETTARRFPTVDGERWYRTGDRVEQLSTGEWAFLGRVDRERKVNGRRVAPEEIEACIAAYPGVHAVAVVPDGNARWTAHVEPHLDDAAIQALEAHVARHLPPWMRPTRWVPTDRLPRHTSEKLDHRQLAGAGFGQTLAKLWCDATGAPATDTSRFDARGADSLAALALTARAEAAGFAAPTAFDPGWRFTDWIDAINAATRGATDVRTTAALLRTIDHAPHSIADSATSSGSRVLLTGATGFLGAHLLFALEQRGFEVTALVRASDPDHARARLDRAADRAGAPRASTALRTITADLTFPRFGLSDSAWRALAQCTDRIVHAAADTRLNAAFEDLFPVSVTAVAEVAALATTGVPKALHAISTLSVFTASERPAGPIAATDDPLAATEIRGGYAQSKWTAEALLRRRSPPHTSIYRLGLLTPAPRTAGSDDHFSRFVRGLARLGAVPSQRAPLRFDVSPVDAVAAAIADAVAAATPQVLHLANPVSAASEDLFTALRRVTPVADVDAATWATLGGEVSDADAAFAWLGLSSRFGPSDARHGAFDLFEATGYDFQTSLATHPPDVSLLERLVRRALLHTSTT